VCKTTGDLDYVAGLPTGSTRDTFPQRTSTITDVGFDVCGGYVSLLFFEPFFPS
jgi:hypothetical protein